jgi:single-strand DNA-binding protein
MVRDPELRFANSGTAIAKLGVATNERKKNPDTGQWEDGDTSFWDCTAFGQLAENIGDTLEKGQAVIIRGKIKQEKYEAKDGSGPRTSFGVIIDEIGPNLRWVKPKGESRSRADEKPPF